MLTHIHAVSRGVTIESDPPELHERITAAMVKGGDKGAAIEMQRMFHELSDHGVIIVMYASYGVTVAKLYQGGVQTGFLNIVNFFNCELN